MEKHVKILGILYIVFSALGIIAGLTIFVVLTGAGIISGDEEAMAITAIIGIVIGAFLLVLSLPGIIGGIGLLKQQNWARILVLVLGFLNLINIPFGTALGIYTLWVFLNDETIKLFTVKKP